MTFVLPGDVIPTDSQAVLKFGPGMAQYKTEKGDEKIQARASRAGLLGQQEIKYKAGAMKGYWIEGQQRRVGSHGTAYSDLRADDRFQYSPALGELVLGVITARHAEGYRVDIGSSQYAALDALAFEGATKRSKPNLKVRSHPAALCIS